MTVIDMDSIRRLRDLRTFAVVCALLCFGAVASGWQLAEDILASIACVVFVLQALGYTAEIRQRELALPDVHPRKGGDT